MENEEKKTEKTEKNQEERSSSERPSFLGEATLAAERLKAENERMEQNIKRLEELKAFEMLGGRSEAGKAPEVPKEESPQDYAKKVLSGKL